MSISNNYQYRKPHVSAESQPRILAPKEIPEGYQQRESGLLVRIGSVGNIATRSIAPPSDKTSEEEYGELLWKTLWDHKKYYK